MKTKIFILLLCSIVFASCSQDEISTELSDDVNLITNNSTNRSSDSLIDCVTSVDTRNSCQSFEPDVIGWQEPFDNEFTITYKAHLSLDEIDCVRMAYFNCFQRLRMSFLQPSNPYIDYWKIIPPNDTDPNGTLGSGSVATTTSSDDRLEDVSGG